MVQTIRSTVSTTCGGIETAGRPGEKVPAGVPKNLVYAIWMGSTDHLMYKVFFELGGSSTPPVSKVVAR